MSATRSPWSSSVKRLLVAPLTAPKVSHLLARLTGTDGTIFMCHRFRFPDLGVQGEDPELVRHTLVHLRKEGYDLVSLREMFRRLREGVPLRRAVAFTIDDGYIDHAEIAAPVFAACDCPVTTFVPSGFLDRLSWFWWDKLTLIFENTRLPVLRARLGQQEYHYTLDSPESRARLCMDLNFKCQDAPEEDRLKCVADLSREAEVELPAAPPPRFSPMSWDQARNLESGGMSFGAHTVTHPVLSTVSAEQSGFEIRESWKRLTAEVRAPVPVFCYPNGRQRDFGQREISTVRKLGLWGAVTGHPGVIDPDTFRASPEAPYLVPRFAYQGLLHTLQSVSGLEMFKARLRGQRA